MDNWKKVWFGSTSNPTKYSVEYVPGVLAVVKWKNSKHEHRSALYAVHAEEWSYYESARSLPEHVRQSVAGLVTA